MEVHLFGAATPAGEALRELCQLHIHGWKVMCYSRHASSRPNGFYPVDLNDPASFSPAGDSRQPKILISFAPIWLFAPFLQWIAINKPKLLINVRGLIVCSSSSTLTKRFSANRFDRLLAARLATAEDQLISTSSSLQLSCRILRPTIIYGKVGPYGDRNLSALLRLMHRFPFIPLPAETGMRQPIHATQLAGVTLCLARQLSNPELGFLPAERICVGGDTQLNYTAMLRALQNSLPPGDPARRCRLIPIPNRLFFLLAAPLVLRSPKAFEAVLRIGADLCGFTPVHQLLGEPAQAFPVLPLAR
jgi:hypothetical protein